MRAWKSSRVGGGARHVHSDALVEQVRLHHRGAPMTENATVPSTNSRSTGEYATPPWSWEAQEARLEVQQGGRGA